MWHNEMDFSMMHGLEKLRASMAMRRVFFGSLDCRLQMPVIRASEFRRVVEEAGGLVRSLGCCWLDVFFGFFFFFFFILVRICVSYGNTCRRFCCGA